jgi:hypothetical protein
MMARSIMSDSYTVAVGDYKDREILMVEMVHTIFF